MQKIVHNIIDAVGIHARPASQLVKKVSEFESSITITKGDKSADARKLIAVMGLGAKHNDEITITIEGSDEEKAFEELKVFFETF